MQIRGQHKEGTCGNMSCNVLVQNIVLCHVS